MLTSAAQAQNGSTSDAAQSQAGLEDPVAPETSDNPVLITNNNQSQQKVILSGDQLRLISASVNEEGAWAAIDGDTGTHWEVSGGWPQEIILELPKDHHVTAVQYVHGSRTANYLTQYKIYASPDGVNWINTSAPGTLKNTSLKWEVRLSWPKDARYIRIVYLGSGGGESALTGEIRVISDLNTPQGSEPPPVTPSVPTPPPAPACSVSRGPGGSGTFDVPATSNTFYVSPNGSDSVSCEEARNANTPRRTIGAAVSCLGPDSTLFVRGGTYTEYLSGNIPSGDSWSAPVVISAYPGEQVTIRPAADAPVIDWIDTHHYIILNGFTIDTQRGRESMKFYDATHIRIQNNELTNSSGNSIQGGGDYIELLGNNIHSNGTANSDYGPGFNTVYMGGSNNLFDSNVVHDNVGTGLAAWQSKNEYESDNTFRNNILYNNINQRDGYAPGGGGIFCGGQYQAQDRCTVYNNIVYGNDNGITAGWGGGSRAGTGHKVYNNTVVDNGPGGGIVVDGYDVLVENNIIWNNDNSYGDGNGSRSDTVDLRNNATGVVQSNFTSDPGFTNAGAGDYSLQSGSPAAGMGANPGVGPNCEGTP